MIIAHIFTFVYCIYDLVYEFFHFMADIPVCSAHFHSFADKSVTDIRLSTENNYIKDLTDRV